MISGNSQRISQSWRFRRARVGITQTSSAFGAFRRLSNAVSVGIRKMADGDIDLYADDLEQDFAQVIRISF